jgi:hypothetical protein
MEPILLNHQGNVLKVFIVPKNVTTEMVGEIVEEENVQLGHIVQLDRQSPNSVTQGHSTIIPSLPNQKHVLHACQENIVRPLD